MNFLAKKSGWCSLLFILYFSTLQAQKKIALQSPDSRIQFSFEIVKGTAQYSVALQNQSVIEPSSLSLNFSNGLFKNNLTTGKTIFNDTTENYTLFAGKTSAVMTRYRSAIIPIIEKIPPYRTINLHVKIFNDGLAFRYEIPAQNGWNIFELLDENTGFKLSSNPTVRCLFQPNYLSSHEGLYTVNSFSETKDSALMDIPALFQFSNKIYLAITEAALLDYAGMYLAKEGDKLVSKLSPLPNQTAVKVKATLPHHSPWRVVLLSDRVGTLLESNIITTLNEPSKIKDLSWLHPGKTTFPWWNGNVVPDTLNAPGNNFVTQQYYIDFCARNGIAYHSVVEYGLHQWYMDDGISFMPGPHNNVTQPVPGLDMKQVCDYAASKAIGIRVWVHWAALYPRLDSAFAQFEKWGIQGMMVDFMDRDDQEMVNIQTEILEKAAQHHLHIQFHGAYKPTGLNRTYPNEFTREGTLNYEADKWNPDGVSPDHDINIPFTRMLAGSTDYHLGGFRAVPQKDFKAQYTRPVMLGTRCHMLAMYVVLENYQAMVCDYPAAYEGQPGFDFIKQVPTTWDETKVLAAEPGEYVAIARRKGSNWYIGAITNHQPRTLSVPLSFLNTGNYEAVNYKDSADAAEHPNGLIKQSSSVNNKMVMPLQLASGGGAAIYLKKN